MMVIVVRLFHGDEHAHGDGGGCVPVGDDDEDADDDGDDAADDEGDDDDDADCATCEALRDVPSLCEVL